MVTAIAASVGTIVGSIGNMVSSNNARKAAYQTWLAASVPTYTDVFGNYRSEKDQTNLIIIGILGFLILSLIMALILKSNQA